MIKPVPDPPTPPETKGIVLTKAAGVYDWLSPPMSLWQQRRMNRNTAGFLSPSPGDSVLDIGCATGGLTLAVAERLSKQSGGICIGIDASAQMVRIARKKIANRPCRFDIGLAERLPYEDSVFDKAASSFFFHHLDLDHKLKSLKETFRVLKPEGTVIIVDIDVPTNWFGRFCARAGEWLFQQPEIGENIDGRLPPLFQEAGFADIQRLAHHLGYYTTFRLRKPS